MDGIVKYKQTIEKACGFKFFSVCRTCMVSCGLAWAFAYRPGAIIGCSHSFSKTSNYVL